MSGAKAKEHSLEPREVRAFLSDNPDFLRGDAALLAELGLRADAANVIDFGPAALARVHEAHKRESSARKHLEATARANFAAQAQTHGAVVDMLESRNHADLARRVDELAQLRFGLIGGVVALEGPERTPAGWRMLIEGQIDMIIGHDRVALMGFEPVALGLFGDRAPQVRSMAMVRMAIWEPSREGLLAFGSADEHGFTEDMGAELVAFLARVVERTAERWPVL
ncbi:DUF484 family protein [Phenylobacterium sp. 58.2.17]|uniref:DUF484 family protein n=1 Tax=Phenylobacterium sp. 58.2.17 TaxID=2969306 RepID=UPI0022642C9F|nr:DUF484 family protein [Phenylobacterium sp. 58.2.17]MCX7586580.1 DUF484 family protein [Phenylobacterium sp. 58.2.17]